MPVCDYLFNYLIVGSAARSEQGRTVDALAHGGDEGRDKLR